MIEIRPGGAADAPAIAQVRRDSWHAAYQGIIAVPIIDRATATGGPAVAPPPYRRTLVAEAGEDPAVVGYASFGPERTVVPLPRSPHASGAQRTSRAAPVVLAPAPSRAPAAPVPSRAPAAPAPVAPAAPDLAVRHSLTEADSHHPLTEAGRAGVVGELYALYVTPAWWSTGAGRALMDRVLALLAAERYQRAVLWVLADNARARGFYERAGFAPDGATNILTGLGGVLELRYSREL